MPPSSTIRRDIWNLPNALTLGRIAVIPIVCWLLISGSRVDCIIAATLFGIAAFTDWLDGYIARKRNLVSLTGKLLDPLADKLLVMAVLCTLLAMGDRGGVSIPLWFVILALGRELTISGLRALAASEGIEIAVDWGGKWKTAFQLVGLVCIIIHYDYPVEFGLFTLHINYFKVGFILLLISLAYSLWSAWLYFTSFIRNIDKASQSASSESA